MRRTRSETSAVAWVLVAVPLLALLAGCGKPPEAPAQEVPAGPGEPAAAGSAASASEGSRAPDRAGPAPRPGGGLVAEPSGAEGVFTISIRWSAKIVTGDSNIGVTTVVYKRTTQLVCPVTSGDESPASYFAAFDRPNADPTVATGSYQPWWNENCAGSLTVDDTFHSDDPTLAGPEPVLRTTGTQPLETPDAPMTVETDLNRARTRYLFLAPDAVGFQREVAPGAEPSLVRASGAPMAALDFTLEGPIGDGKREIAVQGGVVQVEWTFARGKTRP